MARQGKAVAYNFGASVNKIRKKVQFCINYHNLAKKAGTSFLHRENSSPTRLGATICNCPSVPASSHICQSGHGCQRISRQQASSQWHCHTGTTLPSPSHHWPICAHHLGKRKAQARFPASEDMLLRQSRIAKAKGPVCLGSCGKLD